MFALVDFSRSTGQILTTDIEKIIIYPNPFTDYLKIEINIPSKKNLNVTILDINGKLIRTLYDGIAEGSLQTDWDGKTIYNSRFLPVSIFVG